MQGYLNQDNDRIYISTYLCMYVCAAVCLSGGRADSHESHYINTYKQLWRDEVIELRA